jgi:hypothetical protein
MKNFCILFASLFLVVSCTGGSSSSPGPAAPQGPVIIPPDDPVQPSDTSDYQVDASQLDSLSGYFVAATELDFGAISPTDPIVSKTIRVKNTSSTDVNFTMSTFSTYNGLSITSNTCLSVVPANDSCLITVALDSSQVMNGAIAENVLFTSGANSLSVNLKAQISGRPYFDVFDAQLAGSMIPGFNSSSGALRSLDIMNNGMGAAFEISVSVDSPYKIWYSSCSNLLPQNEGCSINILFNDYRTGSPSAGKAHIYYKNISSSTVTVIDVDLLTGLQDGSIVIPPIVYETSSPQLSAADLAIDDMPDVSLTLDFGNTSEVSPAQYQGSGQFTCPSSMTGVVLRAYIANSGVDSVRAKIADQYLINDYLIEGSCNGAPSLLNGTFSDYSRKIYNEDLVMMTVRLDTDFSILAEKVSQYSANKIYNTPPQLGFQDNTLVFNQETTGGGANDYVFAARTGGVLSYPVEYTPIPDLQNIIKWVSCQANLPSGDGLSCNLLDTSNNPTAPGLGGIQGFSIVDNNHVLPCGNQSATFVLKLCPANIPSSSFCRSSTVTYAMPTCVCRADQVIDSGGQCNCPFSSMENAGVCQEMPHNCSDNFDFTSCGQNSSINSVSPSCTWVPFDSGDPTGAGSCTQ